MCLHVCRVGSEGAVGVFEAKLQLVSKCNVLLLSVSDSPVEVEVSHVFGRFLGSAHLLVVEDDPPAAQRDQRFKEKPSWTEA